MELTVQDQEKFCNYELYFYLLCQDFHERDFTSGLYTSLYKQVLMYSMYSKPVFKVNVENNTVGITFVFSRDLRDHKFSGHWFALAMLYQGECG